MKTHLNNLSILKRAARIFAAVVLSHCYFALAGELSLTATADQFANRMAPHVLRSAAQGSDSDSVVSRTWAFLLLRMPCHAAESLQRGREVLQPMEISMFEAAAGQLASSQNSEYSEFLAGYLPFIDSSNALLNAHLSKLQSVAGGGPVTNLSLGGTFDLRFLPVTPNTVILVTIPSRWLTETCFHGSYKELADQVRLVAELRRQSHWLVVIEISQQFQKEAMTVKALDRGNGTKNTRWVILPTDQIFNGNDQERQRACEAFILKVINASQITNKLAKS